jgi:hypothetical protein
LIPDQPIKVIYWHRELPPFEAQAIGEHTVEAVSGRVPDTIVHRDELWERCRAELTRRTSERLTAEIGRLRGRYARVIDELIDTRRDARTGEAWLHGRFRYML